MHCFPLYAVARTHTCSFVLLHGNARTRSLIDLAWTNPCVRSHACTYRVRETERERPSMSIRRAHAHYTFLQGFATPESLKIFSSSYTACVYDVSVGNFDICVADFWYDFCLSVLASLSSRRFCECQLLSCLDCMFSRACFRVCMCRVRGHVSVLACTSLHLCVSLRLPEMLACFK